MNDKETALEAIIRTPNAITRIEYAYCPVCNHQMTSARAVFMKHGRVYDYAYCETCGQKVKWT